MVREVQPKGQKAVRPWGTMAVVVLLVGGLLFALTADGRGDAVGDLVMMFVQLVCLGYVTVGLLWALYLLWGKNRDTNAGLLSLGLSVLAGFILLYLLFTGQLFAQ